MNLGVLTTVNTWFANSAIKNLFLREIECERTITLYNNLTLAAEFDTPWVTFLIRPPTLPSFNNPDIPSVTSLNKPNGFPRKSTDPKILAA